jgi:hypothetical protein
LERYAIARPFFQRRAKRRHCLLQTRRPTHTLAKRRKRGAKVILCRRPVERHPIARQQFERTDIEWDCLLQRLIIAALLTFTLQRVSLSPNQDTPLFRLSIGHQ